VAHPISASEARPRDLTLKAPWSRSTTSVPVRTGEKLAAASGIRVDSPRNPATHMKGGSMTKKIVIRKAEKLAPTMARLAR
jgi:hypothetical protein